MRAVIALAVLTLIGCGSGGTDDTATTSTSSASETTTVRDCFFVEDSEGNLINVGEVGSPDGEQAASDAESFKSNITVNNCGGDVHVSGDTITTTETNTNVDSNNTDA